MLGNSIELALDLAGITQERVSRWIGKPCNCKERIQKLNALGFWAVRVLKGKTAKAKEFLEGIIG